MPRKALFCGPLTSLFREPENFLNVKQCPAWTEKNYHIKIANYVHRESSGYYPCAWGSRYTINGPSGSYAALAPTCSTLRFQFAPR